MKNSNSGWPNWADHPLVVLVTVMAGVIAIVAGIIAIFVFISGKPTLPGIFDGDLAATANDKTTSESQSEITLSSPAIVEPTSAFESARVISFDDFNGLSYEFSSDGKVTYTENSVKVSEGGGITHRTSLPIGRAMVFLLKYTEGEFNCYLANKDGYWNYYVGIKSGVDSGLITSVAQDGDFIGGEKLEGNLFFSPDHWYFVMIHRVADDTFYIRVWDKEDPSEFREKGLRLGPDWEHQQWYPHLNVTRGQVFVDYYQEIVFGQ